MLEIFKALSDKNRLRIVAVLSRYEELCACQITELLQVTGATASRHLRILQHAGLVSNRKDGRWIYYRMECPAGAESVLEWLESTIETSESLQNDSLALQKILGVTREELCRMQRGETCCPK